MNKIYDDLFGIPQNEPEMIAKVVEIIKEHNGKTVLDIGCAEGEYSIQLATLGFDVTASDISKTQINKLSEYIEGPFKNKHGLKAIVLDIEDELLEVNDKYDIILFLNVIEHLKSPYQSLINIREFLHSDGYLIICTPNSLYYSQVIRAFFKRKSITYTKKTAYNLHTYSFTLFSISKLLNFIGFEIEHIYPTRIGLPIPNALKDNIILNWIDKKLAIIFPYYQKDVLILCRKSEPLTMESIIEYNKKINRVT